ncbi:hypothetical protein ACJVC5_09280 [Peredibacter sp. HCB2-198]|uniref:hypothetical protein n=1 Tax=Peredibacter sp. HCB2-198 TaxID=3383025 RepID=UPI0038B67218
MQQYATTTNREEIIKLVQKKFEASATVSVWQKDPKTEQRTFLCEGKFSSIDTYEGIFMVDLDPGQMKNFKKDLETYFLFEAQGLVFKTRPSPYMEIKNSIVAFSFPQSVKLKELRNHPRIYFSDEEKRIVSVRFSDKNSAGTIAVFCPIYNISKSGICIIVTKETLSNAKLNEAIEIQGLSFFECFADEVKAVVKNARVFKKGFATDDSYALGLEFKL